MNGRMYAAVVLVVGTGCGGGTATVGGGPPPAPRGAAASPGCPPTSLAAFDAQAVAIYEIDETCTAHLRATHALADATQAIYDVAWAHRDGALVAALGRVGERGPDALLQLSAPHQADGGTRTALVAPPGGEPEPDGFTFALADDDAQSYVERCVAWESACAECEEVEEWFCREHVYVPTRGGAATTLPAARFATTFDQGRVPGTRIDLAPTTDGTLGCVVDGVAAVDPVYVPYPDAPPPAFVVAALSATTFLLGVDVPGSRMDGARSVSWQRVHGCDVDAAAAAYQLGPAGYWASSASPFDVTPQWTLAHGADPGRAIVDDAGAPLRIAATALVWAP